MELTFSLVLLELVLEHVGLRVLRKNLLVLLTILVVLADDLLQVIKVTRGLIRCHRILLIILIAEMRYADLFLVNVSGSFISQ